MAPGTLRPILDKARGGGGSRPSEGEEEEDYSGQNG